MRCRRSLIRTSVVAAAAVSVLTAGCGGGSSTTGATITPSPLVAYSECMRSHGVTGFPDPTSNGEIPKEKVVAAVVSNPRSPAAQRACRHLIPESGLGPPQTATPTRTRLADALSFARCVRAHGFPSFPDPTSQGQLTPEMVTAAGIDLHQPKVLRVGLVCVPASHGLLSPAAIERAVHGG
jgi:hypothetical protein